MGVKLVLFSKNRQQNLHAKNDIVLNQSLKRSNEREEGNAPFSIATRKAQRETECPGSGKCKIHQTLNSITWSL
ncbi:hypothetical protein O6P43_014841 [Quillaja saponaria]|uniref:Uncharacterized protein n=1 Tax=Quillaja saponaria TaxID=32244 RepID=A0AAD7PRD3_QUISA|nr:hypothetical protein O6P43_014841 [Quillaja saponaria]